MCKPSCCACCTRMYHIHLILFMYMLGPKGWASTSCARQRGIRNNQLQLLRSQHFSRLNKNLEQYATLHHNTFFPAHINLESDYTSSQWNRFHLHDFRRFSSKAPLLAPHGGANGRRLHTMAAARLELRDCKGAWHRSIYLMFLRVAKVNDVPYISKIDQSK